MKHQPIPDVTPADVKRVAKRDFADEEAAQILAVFDEFGMKGSPRICLAILKLAAGDITWIQPLIDESRRDFRDVILPAEYPSYLERAFLKKVSEGAAESMIEADWQQYKQWFEK